MDWKLKITKYKLVLIIMLLSQFSCIEHNDGSLTEEQINSFKQKILTKGDNYSYSRLLIHYTNSDREIELIPYSILMGDTYKNPTANRLAYIGLIKLYNNNKYNDSLILHTTNKDSILIYLKRAVKLGDEKSIEILKSME